MCAANLWARDELSTVEACTHNNKGQTSLHTVHKLHTTIQLWHDLVMSDGILFHSSPNQQVMPFHQIVLPFCSTFNTSFIFGVIHHIHGLSYRWDRSLITDEFVDQWGIEATTCVTPEATQAWPQVLRQICICTHATALKFQHVIFA